MQQKLVIFLILFKVSNAFVVESTNGLKKLKEIVDKQRFEEISTEVLDNLETTTNMASNRYQEKRNVVIQSPNNERLV
jgi:hypothetical protein